MKQTGDRYMLDLFIKQRDYKVGKRKLDKSPDAVYDRHVSLRKEENKPLLTIEQKYALTLYSQGFEKNEQKT